MPWNVEQAYDLSVVCPWLYHMMGIWVSNNFSESRLPTQLKKEFESLDVTCSTNQRSLKIQNGNFPLNFSPNSYFHEFDKTLLLRLKLRYL
jgi:hypothetical protein